jgi:hypothetical protein
MPCHPCSMVEGVPDLPTGARNYLALVTNGGGSFGTHLGTSTMTAPNGKHSLTGSYSGQNDNAGDAYNFGPFSGELTITGERANSTPHRGLPASRPWRGPIVRRSVQSRELLDYAATSNDSGRMVGKQEIIGNNNQDPGGQARLDLSAP